MTNLSIAFEELLRKSGVRDADFLREAVEVLCQTASLPWTGDPQRPAISSSQPKGPAGSKRSPTGEPRSLRR